MRKHKIRIIAGIIIAIALVFVFWYGGDAPGLHGWTPQPEENVVVIQNDESADTEIKQEKTFGDTTVKEENKLQKQENTDVTEKKAENIQNTAGEKASDTEINTANEECPEEQGMVINEDTGKDQYITDTVPEGRPLPIEPQDLVISDKELTCTLSVKCDIILNNIAWLDKEKIDIVPEDGVIFASKTVTFYEGESVFNLLVREMKRNKIHMEFENIPIYNSAYIEGIANLYEFDCGELSGWMYKVNDWFPDYGCSRYQLKECDRVEWVYTCDLGADVGGGYSSRNGK